jgi:DnaK suppressor protein
MNSALLERNRTRLLEMQSRLIPTVQTIEQGIIEDVRAPGDISNAPTHMATEAEEGIDRNVALAQNEQGLLEQVEDALVRVENGTYGKCQNCGKEVSAERLEALPYTSLCIKCAASQG